MMIISLDGLISLWHRSCSSFLTKARGHPTILLEIEKNACCTRGRTASCSRACNNPAPGSHRHKCRLQLLVRFGASCSLHRTHQVQTKAPTWPLEAKLHCAIGLSRTAKRVRTTEANSTPKVGQSASTSCSAGAPQAIPDHYMPLT